MQSGWGGMGGGAWGSKPQPADEDEDQPQQKTPSAPAFGQSFKASQPSAGSGTANTSNGAFSGAFTPAGGTFTPMDSGPAAPTFGVGSGTRESDLNKREAALVKKEAELKKMERELMEAGGYKKKNFPICMPLWHHDIVGEIPENSRRVVREMYICWWMFVFCMSYQIFCASVMLGYSVGDKVPSWFLSLIYWVLGVPLSIILWYKRVYYAARDDSKVGFAFFLFFFLCHCCFCIWCAIAVPVSVARWSFSGWVTAFTALGVANPVGIIYVIGSAFWSINATYCLWCLKDSWMFFRGRGGTAAVKQELALNAFKSQAAGTV